MRIHSRKMHIFQHVNPTIAIDILNNKHLTDVKELLDVTIILPNQTSYEKKNMVRLLHNGRIAHDKVTQKKLQELSPDYPIQFYDYGTPCAGGVLTDKIGYGALEGKCNIILGNLVIRDSIAIDILNNKHLTDVKELLDVTIILPNQTSYEKKNMVRLLHNGRIAHDKVTQKKLQELSPDYPIQFYDYGNKHVIASCNSPQLPLPDYRISYRIYLS
ncbi:hypothetical protein OSTOST_02672 [Ostertagia ostertagi]